MEGWDLQSSGADTKCTWKHPNIIARQVMMGAVGHRLCQWFRKNNSGRYAAVVVSVVWRRNEVQFLATHNQQRQRL